MRWQEFISALRQTLATSTTTSTTQVADSRNFVSRFTQLFSSDYNHSITRFLRELEDPRLHHLLNMVTTLNANETERFLDALITEFEIFYSTVNVNPAEIFYLVPDFMRYSLSMALGRRSLNESISRPSPFYEGLIELEDMINSLFPNRTDRENFFNKFQQSLNILSVYDPEEKVLTLLVLTKLLRQLRALNIHNVFTWLNVLVGVSFIYVKFTDRANMPRMHELVSNIMSLRSDHETISILFNGVRLSLAFRSFNDAMNMVEMIVRNLHVQNDNIRNHIHNLPYSSQNHNILSIINNSENNYSSNSLMNRYLEQINHIQINPIINPILNNRYPMNYEINNNSILQLINTQISYNIEINRNILYRNLEEFNFLNHYSNNLNSEIIREVLELFRAARSGRAPRRTPSPAALAVLRELLERMLHVRSRQATAPVVATTATATSSSSSSSTSTTSSENDINAINATQKTLLKVFMEMLFEDIHETNPKMEIKALKFMRQSMVVTDTMKDALVRANLWDTVKQVRDIYTHPCPQNSAYSTADVPGERYEGDDVVIYRDFAGRIHQEQRGLLSLTVKNDTTAKPITKAAVVHYVNELIEQALKNRAASRILFWYRDVKRKAETSAHEAPVAKVARTS